MSYGQAVYDRMMKRLREIDESEKPLKGTGVCIAIDRGYVSGLMYLISSDVWKSFVFASKKDAQAYIDEFSDFFKDEKVRFIDNPYAELDQKAGSLP